MKPSLATQALDTLVVLKTPCFLWGPPGIGKSQLVAQCGQRLGMDVTDIRAVLLDPVDLRGLPHLDPKGNAAWASPAFLPTDGKGILFLDELNAAPQLVQAACYQLVLDRKLGEYTLPEGWSIVAAGNRETDKAVTSRMPSALANRLVHLEVEADLDDWTQWASTNGVTPEVIAFIRFKPDLLHAFDPNEKAFPTPRAWSTASRIIQACSDEVLELELLRGTVGNAAACELEGFLRVYRTLPSLDGILMDPHNATLPDSPATCHAVSAGLAAKADISNFAAIIAYSERLDAEYGVCMIKDAIARDNALAHSADFTKWSIDKKDLFQ